MFEHCIGKLTPRLSFFSKDSFLNYLHYKGRSLNPEEGCAATGFQATHYLLSTLLRKIDGNDGRDRTQAHLAETPQEIFSFGTN